MSRAKPKKKTTALAKRKATPPARRNGGAPDMLARAGAKKGLKVTTSPHYFQPVLPAYAVLWNNIKAKDGTIIRSKPYAPFELLLDNLHRRGVVSVETEDLGPVKCSERGCYNAKDGDGDMQHRFKATVTLTNGQRFTGHGEACRHNTTKVTRSSLPRMAETRAKARAMRDATNIGLACVVEIDDFAKGSWREGAAELSNRDMEERAERSTRSPEKTERRALPSPQAGAQPDADAKEKEDKRKAMARLHAISKEKDVNNIGLHAWMHQQENVESIGDLSADKLHSWADGLKNLEGEKLEAFRQKCLDTASGKGGNG